ncbi:endonuclease III [Lactobacillus sp. ESL0684]|uniref:endonuclease III domain-containing protein n=1 Tax=Lactobacillus sp. ESL0684 TaxID=2983213 RepID=UPI0023F67321|nr:endonuclease III [Lactobacillus sp. ESL0684]WEV44273.1 endonuclease III [Lactobacillus sp. ESL0684]
MNYLDVYHDMLNIYGPQNWWPSDSVLETLIGAILVQNTNWLNAEKSLQNLRSATNFEPQLLAKLDSAEIKELIIPSGFYHAKSETIHAALQYFNRFNVNSKVVSTTIPTRDLRNELLKIKGIGNETADVILLYIFQRPVFIADAYSKKMISFFENRDSKKLKYLQVKTEMEAQLTELTTSDFQEFHALIDEHIIDYLTIQKEKS